MKQFITILFCVFTIQMISAQAPQAFKYQAVIRDSTGVVMAGQTVAVRTAILAGSGTGTTVYQETHAIATNDYGLIDLDIGNGSAETGDFAAIDWGADSYFLQLELDETGTGNYYETLDAMPLLSVPYALHAGTAGSSVSLGGSAVPTTVSPEIVGICPTEGLSEVIAIKDNYAYLPLRNWTGSRGMRVIDISNPVAPVEVASIHIGTLPTSIDIEGNFAFVTDADTADLKIIDVSNPLAPTIAGSVAIGGEPVSVDVEGNYAYLVEKDADDVIIVDVSNPASPFIANTIDFTSLFDLEVRGNYLYLNGSNFQSVVISDPLSPVIANSVNASSYKTFDIDGEFACLLRNDSMVVIDLSIPGTPARRGAVEMDGWNIEVAGNFAFVSHSNKIYVVDFSDPDMPFVKGEVATTDAPKQTRVAGSYIYSTNYSNGVLDVIKIDAGELMTVNANGELGYVTQSGFGNIGTITYNKFGNHRIDDFVFGATQLESDGEFFHEKRMFFDKSKGAFRAGHCNDIRWDDANVGNYSFAGGENCEASGSHSVAFGWNSDAEGGYSAAFGRATETEGTYSFTAGLGTSAGSYAGAAFGRYNVGTGSATTSQLTDPIFEVGIGTSSASRENALTILKNGKTGIGTFSPDAQLEIEYGSGIYNPHLLLMEDGNDYSRFTFSNTTYSNKFWTIAAKPGATSSSTAMNFYYYDGTSGTDFMRIFGTGHLSMSSGAYCSSSGVWTNASDSARKFDIQPQQYGLKEVLQLNPVAYNYKVDSSESIGFIAQELEQIIPEVVSGEEGEKGVAYGLLTSTLVNAIKEQQSEISDLKSQIEYLKTQNEAIETLKAEMEMLKNEMVER